MTTDNKTRLSTSKVTSAMKYGPMLAKRDNSGFSKKLSKFPEQATGNTPPFAPKSSQIPVGTGSTFVRILNKG